MTDPTPQQVLMLPLLQPNDAGVATIRDYLIKLLATLWDENEGFDSKKPFGNSNWECDLLIPLIRAGMIDGEVDEDGYLKSCDDDAADWLICSAIQALGATS